MVWPKGIAPFDVHIVRIGSDDDIVKAADKLYDDLKTAGKDVLYDDRDETSVGAKFADADLMGVPVRLTISKKTLAEDSVELKLRTADESSLVRLDNILTGL